MFSEYHTDKNFDYTYFLYHCFKSLSLQKTSIWSVDNDIIVPLHVISFQEV